MILDLIFFSFLIILFMILKVYVLFKIGSNLEYFFDRRISNIYVHRLVLGIFVFFAIWAYNQNNLVTNDNFNVIIISFVLFMLGAIVLYKGDNLKKLSIATSVVTKLITFFEMSYIIVDIISYAFHLDIYKQYYVILLFFLIYILISYFLKTLIFQYIEIFFEKYRGKMLLISSVNLMLYLIIEMFFSSDITYLIAIMFLVIFYIEYSITVFLYLRDNNTILKYKNKISELSYLAKEEEELKLRIIKHDLRNHIIILDSYMQNYKYEEAIQYLKNLDGVISKNEDINICSNKVINFLIASKYNEIKENQIELKYDIVINENLNIIDNDLCVVFGNLLDNAIEACMNTKKIKKNIYIEIKLKRNILFINIKNSSNIKQNIYYKNLKTIKKDKANHGLGSISVKNIIKKYNGNIEYTNKNNEFSVKAHLIL